MKRPIRVILLFVFLIGVAYLLSQFLVENSEPMRLQMMIWRTREVSKGILILLSFMCGAVVLATASLSGIITKSMEASRLRRENVALQRLLEAQKNSSSTLGANLNP